MALFEFGYILNIFVKSQTTSRDYPSAYHSLSMRSIGHYFRFSNTTQKMNFSITNFFRICGQIFRKLWFRWHLLMKLLMENFIFCAVKWLIKLLSQSYYLTKNTDQVKLINFSQLYDQVFNILSPCGLGIQLDHIRD